MSVLNLNNIDQTEKLSFLDPTGGVGIQRFDVMRYPQFEKLTIKQIGFFWQPSEIDLGMDSKDFKDLTDFEKHIFTSNLKRQILLDSVQGRSPSLALLPIVSLPEIENWITTWTFNETIHSRSYTHIIRNIYPNPSLIFDELGDITEIVDCAKKITQYYDDLMEASMWYNLLGVGNHTVNGKPVNVSLYDIKKKVWLCLNSINVLEGVRFYVSFACSWAFAELKKMEGNAKIIKLICRDENVHLASTQTLLKLLPKEDPDFAKIKTETEAECIAMFTDAITQEKEWAKYLFKDGSMIGLSLQLLCDYIDYIGAKRMNSLGFKYEGNKITSNPLPWTKHWIEGSQVQVAPQEVALSSYIIGGTVQDVTLDTFKGFEL